MMQKLLLYLIILALPCFLTLNVLAMPNMANGTDRFAAADTNKDGKLSPEEFKQAFPNINDEAFGMIDLNHDGSISRDEWQAFRGDHKVKVEKNNSENTKCPMIEPPASMPKIDPPK